MREGRARRNHNAVVTTDVFAKRVAMGVATGTGDHATVEICAEGLRERGSWRGRWCREGECRCRYCVEGEEQGGVEVMHCGLGGARGKG